MNHSSPMKKAVWVLLAAIAGMTVVSPVSAGRQSEARKFHAPGYPNLIKVDHRYKGHRYKGHRAHRRGERHRVVIVPAHRRYRDVHVIRRHGHRYRGYGHHHHDAAAYHWLAFTAITVKLLDMVTVSQQRAHESAQIRATAAPIGETIYWTEGGAQGAVTAVRDGQSSLGRYCREFQQTLTVGGRTENAYGTACRQPDGSWEIIP